MADSRIPDIGKCQLHFGYRISKVAICIGTIDSGSSFAIISTAQRMDRCYLAKYNFCTRIILIEI